MELTAILTGRKAPGKEVGTREDAAFIERYGAADTVGQLKECEYLLRKNEMLFNMESDDELIDCRIYEREALLARYQYLLRRVRAERAAAKRQARVKEAVPLGKRNTQGSSTGRGPTGAEKTGARRPEKVGKRK